MGVLTSLTPSSVRYIGGMSANCTAGPVIVSYGIVVCGTIDSFHALGCQFHSLHEALLVTRLTRVSSAVSVIGKNLYIFTCTPLRPIPCRLLLTMT